MPLPEAPAELGPSAPASVASAFSAWAAPSCASLRLLPPAASSPVRLRVAAPWPHGPAEAAHTTLSAEPGSGQIKGALIELNPAFLPAEPGPLRGVLAHEAGHVLGLAHSFDRQAVMHAGRASMAAAERPLQADDVRGVCAVYPLPAPAGGAGWPRWSPGAALALALLLLGLAARRAARGGNTGRGPA